MYNKTYPGINTALVDLCQLLLTEGKERTTRGATCLELPAPILICLTEPTARWVTLPERKWYPTLAYAESLWLASGRNDLAFIQPYLPRMEQFSDDGTIMRAGYGPRLRRYDATPEDLCYATPLQATVQHLGTDQFAYLEALLKQDQYSRRGTMTIAQPLKDQLTPQKSIKQTKDYPCTCTLHFMIRDGALDLMVHMRSNDLIWGFSAVNVFNFTWMQEYWASILGVPIGQYYHLINNLHLYKHHYAQAKQLADASPVEINPYRYDTHIDSLAQFDQAICTLSHLEQAWRKNIHQQPPMFEDPFFQDWAAVLYHHHTQKPITMHHKSIQNICTR